MIISDGDMTYSRTYLVLITNWWVVMYGSSKQLYVNVLGLIYIQVLQGMCGPFNLVIIRPIMRDVSEGDPHNFF